MKQNSEKPDVWSQDWNQQRADWRSIDTMRQIALDAQKLGDDWEAFAKYAAKHQLTINEAVYYLNAYEYGGEVGLRAIHAPDIIPPDVAREAIKTISKILDQHFQAQVPYRLTDEGIGIGLYEIQQRWQTGDRYLYPICQFRLTLAERQWHLYWWRKFDAWWPYPLPEIGQKYSLKARVQQVLENATGCFWG
ncbi:MAG: DUF3024 domain-containing protein [Anaerolineae bacterium]|nr:DUF3024 domain-containing protein [Anaerolineae bacterium]